MKTEVTKVEDEKNVVILKVEVPADKITPSIDKAYREVSQKVRIPGFRKGKVPPQIIDQMIGTEAVLDEALNDLIPTFYPEALESSGLQPVSQPQVDVEQIEKDKPLIFTARVELKPEVSLGDYSVVKLPKVSTTATKTEVDDHIKRMREKFGQLEPVKRAVKEGDYVLVDYDGYVDGKPFEGGSGKDNMIEIGSETFIPGFEEQIVGVKKGEEKDINVTFPKEYHSENLAERDAVFHIKVKEVKSKKVPKLDDDFVKNVSKFDTVEEYKKDIKRDLEDRKKSQQESAKRDGAVDFITEQAEVDIPKSLVEQQIDSMVREFEEVLKRENTDIPKYLEKMGDTFQSFRENFREEAEKRVKTNFVLGELMKVEKIEASDDDVEEELKSLAEKSDQDLDELKKTLTEEHTNYLKNQLSMMKVIDFLLERVKYVKPEEIEKKKVKEEDKKIEQEQLDKKGKKESEAVKADEPEVPEEEADYSFAKTPYDFSDIGQHYEKEEDQETEEDQEKGDDKK